MLGNHSWDSGVVSSAIIGGALGAIPLLGPFKTDLTVSVPNLLRVAGNDVIGGVAGSVVTDTWNSVSSWGSTPTPAHGIHK